MILITIQNIIFLLQFWYLLFYNLCTLKIRICTCKSILDLRCYSEWFISSRFHIKLYIPMFIFWIKYIFILADFSIGPTCYHLHNLCSTSVGNRNVDIKLSAMTLPGKTFIRCTQNWMVSLNCCPSEIL
jgi:hypothetical protein